MDGSARIAYDGSTLRKLMKGNRDALVAEEKELLTTVLALLIEVVPQVRLAGV